MTYDAAWLDQQYEQHLLAAHGAGMPPSDWGYSFCYSPLARISTAKIGLVGLNPAGGRDMIGPSTDEDRSFEHSGFAYVDQLWGNGDVLNPLQQQIKKLIARLPTVADEMFAAQFVPYRSPDWASLPMRAMALETFRPVWADLLSRSSVRLWICLGDVAAGELRSMLDTGSPTDYRSGWGNTRIRVARNPERVVVASLPHLSRYKLFSMQGDALAQAEAGIARCLDAACLGPSADALHHQ